MQNWKIIEGTCVTEGAQDYPTYGVEAVLPDGGVWRWADVDVDRGTVEILCRRLQETQPEACHFRELVLDFIEEMAGKV